MNREEIVDMIADVIFKTCQTPEEIAIKFILQDYFLPEDVMSYSSDALKRHINNKISDEFINNVNRSLKVNKKVEEVFGNMEIE